MTEEKYTKEDFKSKNSLVRIEAYIALGFATSVRNNSFEKISDELSLYDRKEVVWRLDSVKTIFKSSQLLINIGKKLSLD